MSEAGANAAWAGGAEAQLRAARIAVSLCFLVFGLTIALWAVHIPVVVARLDVEPAVLGLALLTIGLGAVISQPVAGWLVGRVGSAPATVVFLPACVATVLVPIVSPTVTVLFFGTFLSGVATGAANVAINTQASEVETQRGRPTMSSFHGFFSLGALIGAVAGGGLVGGGFGDGRGAAVAGVLLVIIIASAARYLLPALQAPTGRQAGNQRGMAITSAVLLLSVLALCSNIVEGSVTDWSALYLVTARGFSEEHAATGFALFQLGMAACRFAGSAVVQRLGERTVVMGGGFLTALGILVVVLAPWTWLSPVGFALVALGAANTIPVMIGVAARISPTTPSAGVATAATGALLGFLVGPPLIGFVAQTFGLPIAIGCLSAAGLVVAIGASRFPWPALGSPSAAIQAGTP